MILTIDTTKYNSDVRYIAKQVKLSLLLSPIWEIIYVIAMYYSIYNHSIIFFTLMIVVMLFYSVIFTVSQQKWLNKYNRIVTNINVKDNYLQLITGKILWKKAKIISLENPKISIKKKSMYWWAKKRSDKTTYIINIEDKEYYFVAEYFHDIEIIIEKLKYLSDN